MGVTGSGSAANEFPHAIWSGEIMVGNLKMRCHILNDGQRIIEEESVLAFLDWLEHGGAINEKDVEEFARWLKGANL